MLYIDFAPTFRKIESFAGHYNQKFSEQKENVFVNRDPKAREKVDDIKNMLRDTHVSLMKKLIECLSSQFNKEQKLHGRYDQSVLDDKLFVLRTNNVSLGKSIGVSPRTIYNRLQRLLEAGFLTAKEFHGTRSDFKIHINTAYLVLLLDGNPLLITSVDNTFKTCVKPENASGQGPVKSGQPMPISGLISDNDRKKIVPTEKRYIYKKNKIIRSGEIVENPTISSVLSSFKGNTTNQESSPTQGLFSKENLEKSGHYDPSSIKETLPAAAAAKKSGEIPEEVQKYGKQLMNFMFATLFSRMHYVAPSQLQASREFLIGELGHLRGKDLKKKFKELQLRMQLAWEYVERDPENRYIPNSPAKYFDPNNPYGFTSTKVWYDQFAKDKRKVSAANERALELMHRWRTLHKVMDRYMENPNSTTYFKCKKYLDGKAPEISETFEQLVVYRNNKLTA